MTLADPHPPQPQCLMLEYCQAMTLSAGDRLRARYVSRTEYRLMQRTTSRRVLPSDLRRVA
jgi:hypothetical protein